MIHIQPHAREIMTVDAMSTFPDECCGFFFGNEAASGHRTVTNVLVVNNAREGDRGRRFVISAKDYLKAEKFAEEHQLQLLGVYHSHPGHPAIPSEHDRISAQPYFSYVIISVFENRTDHIRSWRLNEDFQFEEEEIVLSNSTITYQKLQMATIIIPTPLRKFTNNTARLQVSGNTIEASVNELTLNFPDLKKHLVDEQGQIRSYVNIFVGDEDIRDLQQGQTPILENTVISIVPAIAGGIK